MPDVNGWWLRIATPADGVHWWPLGDVSMDDVGPIIDKARTDLGYPERPAEGDGETQWPPLDWDVSLSQGEPHASNRADGIFHDGPPA